MEIRDYLRAIRRWLWLPLIVPLVAAGIVGALLESQPSKYQADASVIVPAVSAKGFSTSAASQYVATFKDVLISQPILAKVSKKTGVPIKELTSGLSASTVTASSNIIHVVFVGTKGQNTTSVVHEATVAALDAVAQPQLVQAQNSVAAAQNQLQQANASITAYTSATGVILPQQQFNTQQQELNQLLLQLQQATLANDTARATALQGIIAQRQKQLTTLATQVTQFTDLSDAHQAAVSVRDKAAQELTSAQALLSANHNPATVAVQNVGRLSKLSDTLRFTAIAYAVALLLALGFILLLELMRGRRVEAVPTADTGAVRPAVMLPTQRAADGTPMSRVNGNGNGNGNGHGLASGGTSERHGAPTGAPDAVANRQG